MASAAITSASISAPATTRRTSRSSCVVPQAIFGRGKTATIEKPATTKGRDSSSKNSNVAIKKQSILEAFDFSAARSEDDAILIAKARGMGKGQKMSKEQYAALRRKVGGTAKDFWKDSVDVKGAYTDKGYVSDEDDEVSAPPGFAFLLAVVLGLAAATAAVVVRT